MSIVLLEGFDDGLWGSRVAGLASGNVGSSYGLHGDGARVGDIPGESFTVPVSSTELFTLGMAIKIVSAAVTQLVLDFQSLQTFVEFDSNRFHFKCTSGAGSSDIDWYTDTGSVVIGDWHYLEIQIDSSTSSVGIVKWWLDGTLLDSTTTHDFLVDINTTVKVGGSASTDIDDAYIDDIYVTDANGSANTANLGPIEIEVLLPDGNGNSSALTGSDGNSTDNYLLVDNNATAPPATTEYVGSGTEGDLDTYTMGDLTGTPTVVGMVASLYAIKTDSGAKYMRPVVRVSSTDYNGDSEGLAETYSLHEHTWDQNPNTSTAWTSTTINAMELGQEVRDS